MRTSSISGASLAAIGAVLCAVAASACGGGGDETPTFVMGPVGSGGSAGTATATGGTGISTGGTGVTQTGGTGTMTGGTGTTTGGTGTPDGGTGTMTGGTGNTMGGSTTGGSAMGGSGGSGGGTATPTGHFKLLVYCETEGFPHDSIPNGIKMLTEMGAANDFDIVVSDGEQTKYMNDPVITKEGLAPFSMVFFMNPTGNIFTPDEKTAFIEFLHEKKAFAGVHSTTDTEHDWTWYEELVGEIYASHTPGTPQGTLILDPTQLTHPALAGIQSPWTRNDEWYKFSKGRVSGGLPGLQVLVRFNGPEASPGATVGQPISWVRNWEGIRSFYTAMGHPSSAYDEPDVRKHILGGILWAVRRLQP